jgi:2-methylisocitrate lyase-like PEP mutase family enzyme
MPSPALKQALAARQFVVAPGVYDLISALIADRMDFPALYVTGYGTVASHLGIPDAGIATYRDMIERVGRIAEMTRTPIIADADTGYGGLLNVRETVRGYERAGVSAIQIEDQIFPKKCGHTPNRQVVPLAEMVQKIRVACDSRHSADFLIVARTDARTDYGLDEALDRGSAFAEAGADVVFVEALESEAEMAESARRIDAPLLANMANGGRTPILPADRLAAMGFALAIFPGAGFLAAAAALEETYADIRAHGVTTERSRLYDFDRFSRLLGFEDIWEFERRYGG